MIHKKTKGQVWIETVLYTLIGLVLIGIILGFVSPKINESRDKLLIEQSIDTMQVIDSKISQVIASGNGNVGVIPVLALKRGQLIVNSTNNSIMLVVDKLSSPYSENGSVIKYGKVNILTIEGAKESTVYLTIQYTSNITYAGKNDETGYKVFFPAATPYRISIENINNTWINVEEVAR